MVILLDILDRIFELVRIKKMSQQSFAEAIGVSEDVVSDWKHGRSESYTKKNRIQKIAEVLETTTDYLNYGIQPISCTFTAEEQELVTAYRQAGAETRAAARRVLGLKDVEPPVASEKAM